MRKFYVWFENEWNKWIQFPEMMNSAILEPTIIIGQFGFPLTCFGKIEASATLKPETPITFPKKKY